MHKVDIVDDETLLRDLKTGSRVAFEKIYLKYWEKLYTSIYKKVRSGEIAEEIVQDFFVSLWEKRETIKINSSFEGYIFTAVRYQVINYFKKEIVKGNYKLQLQNFEDSNNPTLDQLYYKELSQIIEQEIQQLPDKCQHVFRLSRQENLNTKEIALKLNISTKTVENHLTKALKVLRINLKEYVYFAYLIFLFLYE